MEKSTPKTLGKLVYRGSVKDIYQVKESESELIFDFSDRYSVFDWGEMPDHIPGKGKALAHMGQAFFDHLGKPLTWSQWKPTIKLEDSEKSVLDSLGISGLSHHALGLFEGKESAFVVKKIAVPEIPFVKGTYQYDAYEKRPMKEETLVPLEVIFRFGLPQGSSLFQRIDDPEYRRVLGLYHTPKEGESFARPLVEFSTKLEETDRYIDYEEAQRIAGLSDSELSRLHALTVVLACRLKDIFLDLGIELWDGKFEFAFHKDQRERGERDFLLVDSIGPDELRLMKDGQKLSKEFLRGFYRESVWLENVNQAKVTAQKKGAKNWHQFVTVKPEPLSAHYKDAAASLYQTLAKLIEVIDEEGDRGKETSFSHAPTLEELHHSLREVSE